MGNHLSQEQLLRYLDSELPRRSGQKVAEHLRRCGNCALELDGLKQHLATIAEAELQVIEDSLPSPPEPWPSLGSRLDALANTNKSGSWKRLFRPLEIGWKIPAYGITALVLLLICLLIWGPI